MFITKNIEIIFEVNIVICHSQHFAVSQFPFLIFLAPACILQIALRTSLQKNKYLVNKKAYCEEKKIILKGFKKQSVIKQSPSFPSFSEAAPGGVL